MTAHSRRDHTSTTGDPDRSARLSHHRSPSAATSVMARTTSARTRRHRLRCASTTTTATSAPPTAIAPGWLSQIERWETSANCHRSGSVPSITRSAASTTATPTSASVEYCFSSPEKWISDGHAATAAIAAVAARSPISRRAIARTTKSVPMPASNGTSRNARSLSPNTTTTSRSTHSQPSGAPCSKASGSVRPPRLRSVMFNAIDASSSQSDGARAHCATLTPTPRPSAAHCSVGNQRCMRFGCGGVARSVRSLRLNGPVPDRLG